MMKNNLSKASIQQLKSALNDDNKQVPHDTVTAKNEREKAIAYFASIGYKVMFVRK